MVDCDAHRGRSARRARTPRGRGDEAPPARLNRFSDFDGFGGRRRLRDGKTLSPESGDVECDRLANELRGLFFGFTDSNTSGKVRNVSPVILFAALEDDDVFHSVSLPRLQTRLLQDTPESTPRDIQASLARNGYQPLLRRVFELAVATCRPDQLPSVLFDEANDVLYLHETVRSPSAEPGAPHRI